MVMELLGIKLLYPTVVGLVALISIGVSVLSIVVHTKMVDKKKMDEVRKRMEQHQKDLLKAQESGDKKKIALLEAEQEEIMNIFKQNMIATFKPMMFTTPVVLVAFWSMGHFFGGLGPILDMPLGIPFLTHELAEMSIVNGMDWFGVYIVLAISTSIVLQIVLKKFIKK